MATFPTTRARRYVVIATYPLDEHTTPILYLKAVNAHEAKQVARNYCMNQGWGIPESIQVILIDNGLAIQHIATLR